MENQELKIGDTIITTEDGVFYKKGEIGTVKELKDTTLCYMVQFKHKSEPVSERRLQLYKEEPKFIVGKWYKSDYGSSGKWYYLKISDPKSVTGEAILVNKTYSKSWNWTVVDTIKQALELGYLTDLSEIQPYLPDNHPDKTVKQENLVGRYFKALADNINNSHVIKGNYYKIERTSKSFIYFFTEFTNQAIYSIHESKYHLLEFMPEGWTPESDKIEVFPDVFVGDYVVYLSHDHDSYKKGSIAKVHESSSKGKLVIYWKGKQVGTYWSSFKYHRKATKEQIEWHLLNPNVYDNINDMPKEQPKQYDYEVVHCKTQEEWDFVRNKTTKEYSHEWHEALSYSKELALHIDGEGWSRLSYYQETNSKIYSFEEWCTKFGYTYKPSIPEYVECIASINGNRDPKVGTIIKAEKDGTLKGICLYNSITYKNCFRPSTKEAYEAQNKPKEMTKEELLAEAKRRYPPGTKHKGYRNGEFIVKGDLQWDNGVIYCQNRSGCIYDSISKKWAEILSLPEETTTAWIPKVGDWVECIKEEGFKSDSKNYLIESGIKLGQKYQVIGYVKEYNYVDGKGIQLNGYNCTHPLTSFKPYQEIPTTAYTGVDYSSPKVTIGNTAIDIIAPKKSNSVTLGQIQKEIKINVNFKKPVKI